MRSRSSVLGAVLIALFLALLSGCGSRNLLKSRALELIQQDKGTSEVSSYFDFYTSLVKYYAQNRAVYDAFVSLGLIETPTPGSGDLYKIVLTPKGKQAAEGWINLGYNSWYGYQQWKVPTASGRKVVEVITIITKPELKEASAEFSWQWKLNEIGSALSKQSSEWSQSQLHKGQAKFQVDDSGVWHVVSISW